MSQFVLFTGPALFAEILEWCLLGSLVVQIYIFHISFPNERRWIKTLVYGLFTVDLAQSAFSTYWAWTVLVSGWGDSTIFTAYTWPSCAVLITIGITSMTVQLFFAWRIWMLKRRSKIIRYMSLFIALLSLSQGLSAISSGIHSFFLTSLSDLSQIAPEITLWLIGSVICDFLIAATMTTILLRARTVSTNQRTESLCTTLILHAIETGTVTCVIACLEFSFSLTLINTFVPTITAAMLGKLYTNVLLANLNGRLRHRRWGDFNPTLDGLTAKFGGQDNTTNTEPINFRNKPPTDGTLPEIKDDKAPSLVSVVPYLSVLRCRVQQEAESLFADVDGITGQGSIPQIRLQ
ncbi:hypothetical protein AX17_003226 [Amanita inopinata Kibby_2008]|nr:hypothetical protein AX17_003226 [Amanita inopinata Kibby_2008]